MEKKPKPLDKLIMTAYPVASYIAYCGWEVMGGYYIRPVVVSIILAVIFGIGILRKRRAIQ